MITNANMHVVHEELHNPLTRDRDATDRTRLEILFPELADCPKSHFLALRSYLNKCPQRFFDRNVHMLMRDWLRKRDRCQRSELRDYFAAAEVEIGRAMLFLRQINVEEWHDRSFSSDDDYDLVRFIDKHLHPAYLRLVEGVLATFIRPVAFFSRLERGAGTEGMDVYHLVNEILNTEMAPCVSAYRHAVRNGIGHGGITYMMRSIRYRDKKGNEETIDVKSVICLFDDLLDACNGLASAIKSFLIIYQEYGYRLPCELLIEELIEETSTPWWSIEGCIESELGDSKQLLIYAQPNSRDFIKIYWASLQSAVMTEFFAPGYDRYFFVLRSSKALPGWAIYTGKELERLRESPESEIANYAATIEKNGFFYTPRPALPAFLSRLDTFLHSFRFLHQLENQKNLARRGIPIITSRGGRMHRNGLGYVLSGAVIIAGLADETAADSIRMHKRRILRTVVKQACGATRWTSPLRYLPMGYAYISVYARDFRCRRLDAFGLGRELICTIRIQRNNRIKAPDIMGSTIEIIGNWRIAWNKAWIESGGRI